MKNILKIENWRLKTRLIIPGFFIFIFPFTSLFLIPNSVWATVKINLTHTTSVIGLVGWWTFDGKNLLQNVVDSSGQGKTGYLKLGASGNTATTTAPGKLGQAYNFDGVDDYVSVGNVYNGIQSVAFWIKVATTTTAQRIIDLNGTANVDISGSAVRGNNFTGATIYVDGVLTTTLSDTQWHQVVVTDSSGINASAVDIGRTSNTYLGGILDDVRVYSRALSASEVLQLFVNTKGSRMNVTNTASNANGNVLTNGLIGHWTFDGKDLLQNVVDSSGTGNTGYLITTGSGGTTTYPGKVGQGYYIKTTEDYVNVGSGSNLDMIQDMTISFWLYMPTPTGNSRVLFNKSRNSTTGWRLAVNTRQLAFGVDYATDEARSSSSSFVTQDKWLYMTLTYSSSTVATDVHMYKNAVEETTYALTTNPVLPRVDDSANPLIIGNRWTNTTADQPCKCIMDDVRIYNRILSDAEILQIYTLTK